MGTEVHLLFRELCGLGRIGREVEHPTLGAKTLLLRARVPALAEALHRKHDQRTADLRDLVAGRLLKRAQEGGEARAPGADSRRRGQEGLGGANRLCGFAGRRACGALGRGRRQGPWPPVALDRHDLRQLQQLLVAVGPVGGAAPLDPARLGEEAPVGAAAGVARRVFEDVFAEGGELALLLHDPIVPLRVEDGRRGGLAGCRACGPGGRRRRAALQDPPVGPVEPLAQVAHHHRERNRLLHRRELHEQVQVVRHHHVRRHALHRAPEARPADDLLLEGFGHRIGLDPALLGDSGEGRRRRAALQNLRRRRVALQNPGGPFQRDHVEEGTLVVEARKTAHQSASLVLQGRASARPAPRPSAKACSAKSSAHAQS